jgi:CxxC-x17-CxxC domain-containing protein
MQFDDRMLTCTDRGAEFVFTAGEQAFFHERQFKNLPKRCKACKEKRASAMGSGQASAKQETTAVCSACGKETTIPFRPTQGRPVFCRECFKKK